jgi:hypothetical protein
MSALPTTDIDVQALIASCGLKPSGALTGGAFIMDEAKLRAFALAAIASMSLRDVQTVSEDEVAEPDLYRCTAVQPQMSSSMPS